MTNIIKTPHNGLLTFVPSIWSIKIYDTKSKSNEWKTLKIKKFDFEQNKECWGIIENIHYAPNSTNNPLIIIGYIRVYCKQERYNIPSDLMKMCMDYYNSSDIQINIFSNKKKQDSDKAKLTMYSLSISGGYSKIESYTSHDMPNIYGTLPISHQVVAVGNMYHFISNTCQFKWFPGKGHKIIKWFNFIKKFYVSGLIHVQSKNILLMLAKYGDPRTPPNAGFYACGVNVIWRYDIVKNKWKRLSNLDLPYQLFNIGYCLTNDERYLIVIGTVGKQSMKYKQVLILDLITMKWINEEIELEFDGKCSSDINVIMVNNMVHIVFEREYVNKHYCFDFDKVLQWI